MNDSNERPDARVGDAQTADTRAALVTAARALFAERGYDGASVRAITRRAGSNLGAITYHFGSKEGLYHEVVASMVRPIRDRIVAVARQEAPALDRLDAVVEAYFQHFGRHPDLPRFLMERIASGQLPPPPVVTTMRQVLRTVSGLVAEGQADGSIRPGDPTLMTLSLIAQPVYLTLVRAPLSSAMGVDLPADGLVAHARAFVRAGLSSSRPAEAT